MQEKPNDHVQALNYCAHAIEDLRETESMFRSLAPKSAVALHRIVEMLQSSVKFILPNCCNLVDPAEMRQAHLDLVRLPFPCIAFEAPWDKEEDGPEHIGDFKQTPATKRIALCWEAHSEFEILPGLNSEVLNAFPEGGVFILPIYWGPEQKQWTVTMGGSFIPYGGEIRDLAMDQQLPATRIAHAAKIQADQANQKGKEFRAEPFYVLPEFFEEAASVYGDREKAYAQIILDCHDETMVLIQACSVINCANVTTAEVPAPAALNKKRREKGKQPFFSYKVLQLTEDRKSSGQSGAKGQHNSPRMHLRRGHLRRLENKVVWVRPAMVNAESRSGVVLKDYAVPQKR